MPRGSGLRDIEALGELLTSANPQTLAAYLALRADQGRRPATLRVTLRAKLQVHEREGHASPPGDPFVKKTWKGIRRRLGVKQRKKEPLSALELRRMMDVLPAGLIDAPTDGSERA